MTRPEIVDGRDPTRVVTRRCVAFFVDAFLLAVIPGVTALLVGHARIRKGDCPDPLPAGRNCIALKGEVMIVDKSAFLVFFAVLVLLYLGVFVAVQGLTGASPGKALLGIQVIGPEGTTPGVLRSFVRMVAWLIDMLTLLLPIALWSAWFTPGHRRVGDWLAGTYVVRGRGRRPATSVAPTDATESG